MSPKAQHIELPSRPTTTPAENDIQNEEPPDTPNINNQASTSDGTSSSTQQDIVLVPATKEETKIAIDALLALGHDLNFGIDVEPDDNDLLQPIAPGETLPDPTPMVSEINSDDTEILEQHVIPDEEAQQAEPQTKRSDPNPEKRNYQLAQNRKPKWKFSCVGCSQKFVNNKELNDHFKNSHPPLTCSDCKKLFSTPSTFEKHKYTHYEFMYECETCNKGFHFQSELSANRRKHIADQGLVCFHAKCGKRFKHSSELNAHLKGHTGKPIKCKHCEYSNKDVRNVRAHAWVHTDIQSFLCKCGKTFKWGSQKKRHVDSGTCPD